MSEGIWIKKSLVAAVAAGTLVLAGCNDESTDSNNTSTTTTQESSNPANYASETKPTGSITGQVTDTNGYPIEGATVYLGEQTATTNAGGQYYFAEVAVSQTVKNDDDMYSQALALTIVPPEGYVGATVTVLPQAQIFNGSETDADSNEVENPITTFIDGFNASAGTAALPQANVTVTGVLRNSATGEALSNTRVSLDMVETKIGVDQEQPQDGVETTYAAGGFSATTSSSGEFTFSGVAADSVLRLAAEGYDVVDADEEVDTSDEHNSVTLGDVKADPILSVDDQAPWVVSVAEVVNQAGNPGILNDDVTTTITVNFSETLANAIDENSTLVRDVDGGAYLDHTATLNGSTLTIELASALTAEQEGHEIDLLLLQDDFFDTAFPSNALATASADIGYEDSLTTSQSSSQYVRLNLKAYMEANQNAQAVELDNSQQTEDTRYSNDLNLIQNSNTAFLDVDDSTVGLQQLNYAADDNGDGKPDAQDRIQDLAKALAETVGNQETTDVEANTVALSFQATNAAYYKLDVFDAEGDSRFDGTGLTYMSLEGGEFDGQEFTLDDTTAEGDSLYMVLQGVAPGDTVQITPYDEFGYPGLPDAELLVDNVAPTTVVQKAYGIEFDNTVETEPHNNNGNVVGLQYGEGGEQTGMDDVTVGTPILNVTPRLLGIVNGRSGGTEEEGKEGMYTLKSLFELNTVNNIPGDAENGELFIDEMNFQPGNISTSTPGIYDSNAFNSWAVGDRTIGVAFSENLNADTFDESAVTVANMDNASITEGSMAVNNDVQRQDDGDEDSSATHADLIQFTVDDVMALGNLDHGAEIDFQGAIQDLQGNPGSTNAKVVIGDALPPMVESAQYKGDKLVINFNEAVSVDTTTKLTLSDNITLTLDQDTVDAFNASGDKSVLEVLPSVWGEDLDRETEFDLAQYNESDNTEDTFTADKYQHARLDFSNVEDVYGNSWSDYSVGGTATEKEYFFFQPDFAVVDMTGDFIITQSNNGTAVGDTVLKVRYEASHVINLPANWETTFDVEGAGSYFDYSGGAILTNNNANGYSLSANGKVLTVTLAVDTAVSSGDTLSVNDANFDWTSGWDSSDTITNPTLTRITF